jgi:hypothetical protein
MWLEATPSHMGCPALSSCLCLQCPAWLAMSVHIYSLESGEHTPEEQNESVVVMNYHKLKQGLKPQKCIVSQKSRCWQCQPPLKALGTSLLASPSSWCCWRSLALSDCSHMAPISTAVVTWHFHHRLSSGDLSYWTKGPPYSRVTSLNQSHLQTLFPKMVTF